jgi:hypothetical protein
VIRRKEESGAAGKASTTARTSIVSPQDALKRLPEGRQAKVRETLAEMPHIHRKAYLQAVLRRSRAAAMKAFCLECTGWQKGEVRRCTALDCPLWAWRPYQDGRQR